MKYILSVMLLLGGVLANAQNVNIGAVKDDLKTTYEELQKLVQANLQCAKDSDCEQIPVGDTPCGGPRSYQVASVLNQNLENIKALAFKTAELEFALNKQIGGAGLCMFNMPPDAVCDANICKSLPN